jgi:hypothetical protein
MESLSTGVPVMSTVYPCFLTAESNAGAALARSSGAITGMSSMPALRALDRLLQLAGFD